MFIKLMSASSDAERWVFGDQFDVAASGRAEHESNLGADGVATSDYKADGAAQHNAPA